MDQTNQTERPGEFFGPQVRDRGPLGEAKLRPSARLTRSSFELGGSVVQAPLTNLDEQYWEDFHRAVFTSACYGFRIEDNTLLQNGTYMATEGIVVGYSGDHNDVVRRNSATGLERAFIGEGICADTYNGQSNFIGLQMLCNSNVGNFRDFWDRKVDIDPNTQDYHSMRTIQGALNAPGANVFDQLCMDPQGDYKRTSEFAVLNYIYGQTPTDDPLCFTIPYVNKQLATALSNAPCPPGNYRPRGFRNQAEADQMKSALVAEKVAYGNTRYLYDQLIDAGSTDEVVHEIITTWPNQAWDLRDYLLAKSPYLSTTSLREMVERNIMPAAMVAEVLIANPEATQQERFMQWLQEESGHPLPSYFLGAVYASWDERTYRFTIEATMAQHHAAMTWHANDLIDYWRNDSTYKEVDSLRVVWQQVRTKAGRYAEALTYMQQGNFAQATWVIENIVVEHELRTPEAMERQRMLDVIALLQGVAVSGRTMTDLTTQEQDQLDGMISDAYDRPAVWVSNLLCFAYDRCRAPLTGGNEGSLRTMYELAQDASANGPMLTLQPNPASNWLACSYRVTSASSNPHLLVRDMTGRIVEQLMANGAEGQVVWDARAVPAGAYQVELIDGSKVVAVQRAILQP